VLLALSGFSCENDPRQRLLKALDALGKGIAPEVLIKALLKDAGDDEGDDDEDEDDSDDEDDDSDSGDSDFDAKHLRWPAGTPGSIDGEFRPRDDAARHVQKRPACRRRRR
jgi:hypothetical protein